MKGSFGQNNLLISVISIPTQRLFSFFFLNSLSISSQFSLWVGNVMLKLQSLWSYLGYDLQHREMKHLLDLRGNGEGIYYINCHIVQPSMLWKRGGGSMHSPVLLLFVLQYSISHLFYISYLKTLAEYWGNKWVNAQSSVHAAKVNFPQQKGREVYAWKWLLLFSMWSHLQASTWVGMRGWSHVFIKIGFFFAFALGTYLRVWVCLSKYSGV